MPIFRGSKDATVSTGDIVATQADIAEAVNLAEAAQAAAEAAQAAAETTLDDFDDRYLGAKTSDPTVDNDGDPLIDGALYYNTVDLITRVYDASEGTWSNLKPTSTEQANINALGPIASQVEIVGDNISDVTTVATDLSGSDTIGTVAGSIDNVNTVAGEVGVSGDVTVVATDLDGADTIGTVATNISNVNTVAGIDSNVTTVAGIDSDVTIVSGISANVTTVAGVSTDVTTVANISSDVTTVAADGTDIGTVATNIADVNTTAGSIANINTVAADLNEAVSEIDTVATNITNVTTVGTNISDVNTVASISTDVTTVVGFQSEIVDVSQSSDAVDIIASDLAGAGFDYDLGTITAPTEGVVGTPDGYIITLFNIRDDIVTVAGIADDIVNFARTDQEVRDLFSAGGDLTYNSSTGEFSFTERTDSEVRNLFSAAGDLSYNSTTGEFSVTTYKSTDFDTDFGNKSTTDLTEGANLYYTDARVNADIDARVDKAFVDALNVDADTLDGQQGSYYLDYNNFTNTPTLYTSSDFDSDFSSKSTSDLTEGTNLYYTDARARVAVSASGDLSYDSGTGVFSVTTYKSTDFDTDFAAKTTDNLTEGTTNLYYADSLVDSHLSGGTGVTYSSGTISIGQDVGTTADVTFNSVTADEIDCGSIA